MKRACIRQRRTGVAWHMTICIMSIRALVSAENAWAGEATLAEPIIEENITDIDAIKIGTLELDLTGVMLKPHNLRTNGIWSSGFEAEWRPMDRLGLGGELSTGSATNGVAPNAPTMYVPHAAASYVFLRDRARILFLQAEASARFTLGDTATFADLTEPSLPYTLGVRWATQVGPMTLRAGAFGEAGDNYAHAPVRTSYAALWNFTGAPNRYYVGAEFIVDWARISPFMVIPETLFLTRFFGTPVRMGVGVPLTIGAQRDDRSIGFAFRFVLEPDE
jgi:hypothetical protein